MARAKQNCVYCDGRGKVKRFGQVYSCPYCFPPPGAIVSKFNDKLTEITHYDAKGKVLRVDKTVFKKGESSDGVVNDQMRVQPAEEKQEPQEKSKRRGNKGGTRKRSR